MKAVRRGTRSPHVGDRRQIAVVAGANERRGSAAPRRHCHFHYSFDRRDDGKAETFVVRRADFGKQQRHLEAVLRGTLQQPLD